MNYVKQLEEDLSAVRALLVSTESLAEDLRVKVKEMEEKKREALPPEPTARTIEFHIQWRTHENIYRYVATSVNGDWTVTGGSIKKSFTWDELVAWLKAGAWHSSVYELVTNDSAAPVMQGSEYWLGPAN